MIVSNKFSTFSSDGFDGRTHVNQPLHVSVYQCVSAYRYEYDVQSMVSSSQKHNIFVIILISRHILFRLIQKYISPMITNCLLCCMNCLVLFAKHIVSIHSSHHICMVLKFYNHTLRLLWGYVPMRCYPPLVLL